jgi:hypothetical protein
MDQQMVTKSSGTKGRPRGRPFAKGTSGNPGGRPAKPLAERALEADVRMLARTHGTDAIDKLVELMRGTVAVTIDGRDIVVPVTPTTQMAAAVALLDRGYGRPGVAVELTGEQAGPVQVLEADPLEIIQSRLAMIRERLREEGHPLLIE